MATLVEADPPAGELVRKRPSTLSIPAASSAGDHEIGSPVGSPLRRQLSAQLGASPHGSPRRRKRLSSEVVPAERLSKEVLMSASPPGSPKKYVPRRKSSTEKLDTAMLMNKLDKEVQQEFDFSSMYVLAFLYFESPVDIDNLRAIVKARLFEIPRFRSRVGSEKDEKNQDVYYYEELPIREIPLTEMVQENDHVKTPLDVDEFASDMVNKPDNVDLPLWRAYVMNNMADGRSLIFWAIDHAIGDGTALIAALMSILDDQKGINVPKPKRNNTIGCLTTFRASVTACFNIFVGDQLPGDRDNRLKMKDHRHPTKAKSLATSSSLDLRRVKEVTVLYPGATVNDILMAVLCLSLRLYYQKYDPDVLAKKQNVSANFPIDLRGQGEAATGNKFAPGKITFPIHMEDPCKMIYKIKAQIDKVKVSPEPFMRDFMVGMLMNSSLKKTSVVKIIADSYGKVTMMLSNVPGPQQAAYLGGQQISDMSFYSLAPIGAYAGIVSYNGKVNCGVAFAQDCEPEAHNFSKFWSDAFEQVYTASMAHKSKGHVPNETSCMG